MNRVNPLVTEVVHDAILDIRGFGQLIWNIQNGEDNHYNIEGILLVTDCS